MSSAGDTYTLQKSLATQRDKTPYSKKTIMFAVDTNSGQYTNQVQFDLSSFANVTNGFLNLSEATLQVPVVITASIPSAAATFPECLDNYVGFKNGSWNIINSISVNYDGVEVVQPNNFTNAYVNYKVISSWSLDDLKNFGDSCLYSPDSSNTWKYNNVDRTDLATTDSRLLAGNGICNNKLPGVPTLTALTKNVGEFAFGNQGLHNRMKMINHKPGDAVANGNTATQVQNLSAIRDENNYRSELKNYTRVVNSGAAGFYQQWYVLCNIPLKYLSSFFENMPLVKGAYLKLNITLNTGSIVVNTPNARTANAPVQYCNASDIQFQYTNPVMVTERTIDNVPGGKFLVSVGVVNAPATTAAGFTSHSSLTGLVPHALTSCRITLPVCELKPEEAKVYLESSLSKRVEWTDIYQTQILNVPAGGNFNSMITNGSKDAIGVLLIPMIAGAVNGNLVPKNGAAILANSSFSPAVSPFASEPATSSPLSITQFQVMHGSENIISPFISYTYEEWLYQVNEMNKINGNQSTGLSSGLFSQQDFENGHRYYWCSLFRNMGHDEIPKSITITGTNNSRESCDYLVFIVSKKAFNVNCSTGKHVSLALQ